MTSKGRMIERMGLAFFFFSLAAVMAGCDPFHKKKCEWFLVPDLEFRELVKPGWASLCAVNYTIKRKKCLFTAPLKFSEDIFGKKFRFVDMEYLEGRNLREIKTVKLCDKEEGS